MSNRITDRLSHVKSDRSIIKTGFPSKEEGVEEFIAPCYIISPQGAKRIVYAIEDCVIVTAHANPTNTENLDELAKINVVFNWEEYDEYLKSKK